MAQKGAGMKQLTPPEILAKLDPEQRIAVEAPIGPVRIIAGAGTGKTRTLIYRIAYWDSMGIAHPIKHCLLLIQINPPLSLDTDLKS